MTGTNLLHWLAIFLIGVVIWFPFNLPPSWPKTLAHWGWRAITAGVCALVVVWLWRVA